MVAEYVGSDSLKTYSFDPTTFRVARALERPRAAPPIDIDARSFAAAQGISESTAKRELARLERAGCPLVVRQARGKLVLRGGLRAARGCQCPGHRPPKLARPAPAPPALDPARPYTPWELALALVNRFWPETGTYDRVRDLAAKVAQALSDGTIDRVPGTRERLIPLDVVAAIMEGHAWTKHIVLESVPELNALERREGRESEARARAHRRSDDAPESEPHVRDAVDTTGPFGTDDDNEPYPGVSDDDGPHEGTNVCWHGRTSLYEPDRATTRAQGFGRWREDKNLWESLCATLAPFDPVKSRPTKLESAFRSKRDEHDSLPFDAAPYASAIPIVVRPVPAPDPTLALNPGPRAFAPWLYPVRGPGTDGLALPCARERLVGGHRVVTL